jgi:hypothetical protein
MNMLPKDSKSRKDTPVTRGVLDYFPDAIAAVARVSKLGNDKHNPGEEMHHARSKSTDHADCIVRHLMDRGSVDEEDGQRHSAKVAWRALALLQEEIEREEGAPLARGACTAVADESLLGVPVEFPDLQDLADLVVVPTVTNIGPEEGETTECPNNIHERIAGDTSTARRIKNKYYGGTEFMVGTPVKHSTGYTGVVVERPESFDHFEDDENIAYVQYQYDPDGLVVDAEWVDREFITDLSVL